MDEFRALLGEPRAGRIPLAKIGGVFPLAASPFTFAAGLMAFFATYTAVDDVARVPLRRQRGMASAILFPPNFGKRNPAGPRLLTIFDSYFRDNILGRRKYRRRSRSVGSEGQDLG